MAGHGGKEDTRIIADIDREAIEKFHNKLRENMEREARMQRHWEWRGNKLPPFNIEPLPMVRQRLSTPMTAEDRLLRKQWLKDQELSPNEPRIVPELYPKNFFRRCFSAPWNIFFGVLRPVLGENLAHKGRYWVPKWAIVLSIAWTLHYYSKYNSSKWFDKSGWNIYSSKPTLLPDGAGSYKTEPTDFHDRGFKDRKALLYKP
jgi:NADH dehydrogenase (ubiquinone) 1 beta subcomplex subunit 6